MRLVLCEIVAVERGNAEVPAQMQQIDGAEIAGDGNQRQALGVSASTTAPRTFTPSSTNHTSVVPLCTGPPWSLGGDDVLPAAQVIGGADCLYRAFVGNAHGAEAQQVNADAVELLTATRVGSSESGTIPAATPSMCSIEGEAVFDGGQRAQLGQRRRRPIQHDRALGRIDPCIGERRWRGIDGAVLLSDGAVHSQERPLRHEMASTQVSFIWAETRERTRKVLQTGEQNSRTCPGRDLRVDLRSGMGIDGAHECKCPMNSQTFGFLSGKMR